MENLIIMASTPCGTNTFVPGSKKLGYDSYNGQSFTYEWLKEDLDAIYDKKYSYFYNNDIDSEGAMRGIIYVFPDN